MIHYLQTADRVTGGILRWGILTNGRIWRLYDHRARSDTNGFFEGDLEDLLKSENENFLRVFHLLFRRESFLPKSADSTTFLELALDEGRRYEEKVANDLSDVVFKCVFPQLVKALARESGERLPECRDAALMLLYRLLFVLYAEDRGMLPVNDKRYDDYGLRKRVRDDIAVRMSNEDTFSSVVANYYSRLVDLFQVIDKGDPSIGLPAYDGGLFASDAAPMLEQIRLSDADIAPIIFALSHTGDRLEERRFVNYRDMSVQQLGSIYERLLERQPVWTDNGEIDIRPNPYARKDSGSFYTPQDLVNLIVERTLTPLIEDRIKAFRNMAGALQNDPRPEPIRRAELENLDPAEALLELKVLDPAMGSGHFLVTAVDFLSERIADLINSVPITPEWLDGDYTSPLVKRVATIRTEIIRRAEESSWVLDREQLNDQAIIRRMVLKRCIYGVDKNPLTVELAKVSLWLHSFTVGAPLSFLDHHLRCGDSLLGIRVSQGREDLVKLGGGLFSHTAIQGIKCATDLMQRIEQISDADVAEVHRSATLFQTIEDTTSDLRWLLDFLCAHRWLTGGMKKKERNVYEAPVVVTLGVYQKNGYKLIARGPEYVAKGSPKSSAADWSEFSDRWCEAREIADREAFLHWEVAFPGVWQDWNKSRKGGGFDAIIGNPPWDRIKLQEVEWFAARDSKLAGAPTAAERRQAIRALRDSDSPLVGNFDAAKARSESLSRMVRTYGDYPLLSGGDVNLYSLFVERAMNLIKPNGIVGLLTPSGIYADRNAARFFRSVSTTGRLGGLFDFENRKIFFKDVHASFKFCALIFGGQDRKFRQTDCAFFLHDIKEIYCKDRCFPLTPRDFASVNPNTGTAPVFRTRRDAFITGRIYENHPVLVDRSSDEVKCVWPVKYMRMFDMTNDSDLFRTCRELNADGFYRVPGNRWKNLEQVYVPLYEGKMVQAFDHRAARVVVNQENVNRPAQPRDATYEEHTNPNWLPNPHFWVNVDAIEWPEGFGWAVGFKDVTAVTNFRTMISAVVPFSGFGNTLPLLMPNTIDVDNYRESAWLMPACLNSFALDYIARQKVQGQHLNWYIVEQLPVIPSGDYERRFGHITARDLVRDHVLRLTYTAHDMAPFARDLGYTGEPFLWDEEERRHLRARLDALYFHLYGLSRKDAGYILDTFPIVRREDEKAFRRYRTREMILAYMNALAAGDAETVVDV